MNRRELIIGLILALSMAFFISPFASKLPDGLEKVALKSHVPKPLSDYIWPGIKNEKLAKAFKGLAGTLAAFMLGYLVALILKKARN